MKKVIFLCLLSLSVCLSKPAEKSDIHNDPPCDPIVCVLPECYCSEDGTAVFPLSAAASSPPVNAVETKPLNTTEPAHATPLATETQPAPNKEQTSAKTEAEKATPLAPTSTPPKETAASPTKETPSKESPKPTDDNKTQNKEENKEAPKPKEETTPTNNKAPTEKTSTDKPKEGAAKNGTKPETADVTSKPNDATKTTEAPTSDKDVHIVQSRGFDGPSFIGGIILTLGLLAIGFMGFKYYKNQTERNYHTL